MWLQKMNLTDRSRLSLSAETSGAVIMELALALPVLVLLFLSSTEYVRALQVQQTLAVVSREAANATFRDCVELDNVDECLDYVYDRMFDSSQKALPGMELIITIYTYDFDPITGVEKIERAGVRPASAATPKGRPSKFSLAEFQGPKKAFMQLQQKIAIAETFVSFTPIIENAPISREFYDAAIY